MTATALEQDGATFLNVVGLKAAQGDRREVTGLAVPYDEEVDRLDWFTGATKLKIAPGAAQVRDNAAIFYGHDHLNHGLPVGKITSAEHTDDGLKITARLSETPKGDEVYTLLKDGVLDRFSIGFYSLKSHLEDDDTVLVHDEIDVFETSIVHDPQYSSAKVESVLSRQPSTAKEPHMTATAPEVDLTGLATAEDVTTLSASITQLERQIATLGTTEAGDELLEAPAATYGEFLKKVAARDPEAIAFLERVETLATVVSDMGGHVKDGWVGDLFRTITNQRRVINFFGTSPLPREGMNVEYGQVRGTDTTQVAEQATEGATLAYGKVGFGTATAPVKTYGGWTDFSRQVIERSGVPVVDRAFRALVRKYAATTEAAVRTTATATAAAVEVGSAVHDLATVDGWVSYIVDAATYLDDRGITLDGLFVAPDVFKSLALMRTGTNGEFFLDRNSGSLSVTGLTADVFNVPVVLVPAAAAGTVRGVSKEAVHVWEAGGAPFRLQDEDITNLTEAMSIYGYMAHGITDTEAITRPNDGVA